MIFTTRRCRSRGSAAPTAACVSPPLPRGFTGNPLSDGDLFGNASSFKTINRDNFINFAAEISPDLGRVILIRSAGPHRGTSGVRGPAVEREEWRERENKGDEEIQTERGDERGRKKRRRYHNDDHCPEDSPAVGPFSFYRGRNSGPHATNLPLPGYIHARRRCFLT